ncbi:glycerol-3-phosphate 1-O-acyltransferase PlsY [Anaeromyxobacter oryzae]|uniref:Glycerol-3-phosphate acyltransferase n=1 Tax=Anaeromyxobacter oryzae TaxID=2918170 RepID=A0ABM7WV26_9BACT|nr:glycerol-3-phosphate 1-O-acyltransferase PlsY [Anaeromyxobacter oryzae]BDG03317.1 glycerol-3-phosphate acyltransferase [Anaeromyxobacter oryzae]
MSGTALGAALVLLGYLSGSVPYGVVLGKLFLGVDVRTVGSGNIGATNVARAGGKGMGVAVVILDAAKAMLPIVLAQRLLAGAPHAELWVMAVAIAAFAGHLFPVWLGFKGGKGVATGLGIFAVLAPWAALAGLVAYLVAYLATRISSVGSLLGTTACVVGGFFVNGAASPISWAGVAIGALIFLRHRENIRRLVRGEEKKMKV